MGELKKGEEEMQTATATNDFYAAKRRSFPFKTSGGRRRKGHGRQLAGPERDRTRSKVRNSPQRAGMSLLMIPETTP